MQRSSRRVGAMVLAGLMIGLLLPGVAVADGELPPGGTFVDDDGNVHEAKIEELEHTHVDLGDEFERRWTIDLPNGMDEGQAEVLGQWWYEGELVIEVAASIAFS